MNSDFTGWKAVLVTVATVYFLAGCGSETDAPDLTDEEIVMSRAEAWWKARMERDFETAWEYMTPGFRQGMSREQYVADRKTRSLRYLDVQVVGAECEQDACTVAMDITYQAVGAPAGIGDAKMMRTTTEQWIRIDGQWWRPEPK